MKRINSWMRLVRVSGIVGMIASVVICPMCLCWFSLALVSSTSGEMQGTLVAGMILLTLSVLSLGGGYALFHQANRALKGLPSSPLRLPPLWLLGLIFGLALLIAEVSRGSGLSLIYFPPLFLLACLLPPLAVLAWAGQEPPASATAAGVEQPATGLTWRQFWLAFLPGCTIAVALAFLLEISLPLPFLFLVEDLFGLVRDAWREVLTGPVGGESLTALGTSAFVSGMIGLAVFAPLVEEFCKPLSVLPMIHQASSRRQAFLIGAAGGAGFAFMENLVYAGAALDSPAGWWGVVLLMRALGAAIHPLGAGWVALGWYQAFQARHNPLRAWLPNFGLAVGLHAAWNGISFALLFGAAYGMRFTGMGVLMLSLSAVLLAWLAILGMAALFGLHLAARLPQESLQEARPMPRIASGLDSDLSLAVWAVICLLVVLPLGLVLVLLGGGR